MNTNNMLSEKELRDDSDFLQFMQQTLPNHSAPKDFTQQVMSKVAMRPAPYVKEPWYQSLGLWLVLTGIAVSFIAFFGVLYYLCDQSIMMMFRVIIDYLEKFELEIPSFGAIFSGFTLNNVLVMVCIMMVFLVILDSIITSPKKELLKKRPRNDL